MLVRLIDIINNKTFEYKLNDNMSFNENLDLLKEEYDFSRYHLYDIKRHLFIDKNVKLKEFNTTEFMKFYLLNDKIKA